ncbi:DUF4091 domain-containing protein [Paludibacter sp. 221]|uniref:DUF4091 domain-containing protein n=1 Tax=Paludibacter sp. 221 TaxID=2302939 RepID=UPI0013D00016|nr:DUF4091 domain-containing protein [Paludibacter sp. 221]NDV46590.1 DUF4091 domain-containing protein [Paludibacter sp. 221]
MKKLQIFFWILLFPLLIYSCKEPDINGGDEPEKPEEATCTWILNSLDKVDGYKSYSVSNQTALRMLKNEYESIQFVIETAGNGELTIERDANSNPIEFQCRKIMTFESMEDVLVPCHGKVKPDKKLVKVWLTFKTGMDARAGTYKEIIRFKNSSEKHSVTVSIKIEDAALPETPSLASAFGINPNNLILAGLSEAQKVTKRKEVSDLLLTYRISPYFSTWLSGSMRTEVNSSPYAWNDDKTWAYFSDKRFNRIALPYHGLNDTELEAMLSRARQEGLIDKVYFYVWDEPTKMAEYEQIKVFADKIHKYAPEAKVITTFYRGPEDGANKDDLFAVFDILHGATSIFCTGVWSLQANEYRSQQCKAKLKAGEEWWTYVCMADAPGLAQNSSGIPNRVVMWRNWKEQPTGFLYWVVNGFASMNPLRSRTELPKGDGLLVYPGEPFGVDEPCVSIRLERWRDGAEDYEMLTLFEKKKGRSEAESLLANVYKNPSQYTTNISHVEVFKKKLIDGIVN